MSFFRRKVKSGALAARAEEQFGVGVNAPASGAMDGCVAAWRGAPYWLDGDEGVVTVNFAAAICAELARLACLAIKITVGGENDRARWLQKQIDSLYFRLRPWMETACAWGTVILKPNGESVELLTPDRFLITQTDGETVTGCVFESGTYDAHRARYYTRLEYHRFLPDGRYAVSNRCFEGASPSDWGKPVDMEATPWAGLCPDVIAEGLDRPLFAMLRMPGADGCMGRPVFAAAMTELKDLDVAYSRMTEEIADSRRISLIDDRLIDCPGKAPVRLPRFARRVFGMGPEEVYRDIDPALHTAQRLTGINALLGQIGFKCGFSNGYFVFNERGGLMTATEVEADDRRTVQLVKDIRDSLEAALDGLIYALDKMADALQSCPPGEYTPVYDFGDVTYSREEDRARWYGYVADGRMPFWMYLVKFEGYSEEEAKAIAGT